MQVLKSGVPCVTTSVNFRMPFEATLCKCQAIILPPARFSIQVHGRGEKRPWRQQVTCSPPPRVPRLNGKVPWERLYATHYHTLFENSLLTLPKTLFTLYRMSFAPARKPYRIGLLFTHTSSDFGANSVTKRSCATLRRS